MRYVILGAGATGGTLGLLLAQAGQQVLFIARGPHGKTLQESGLTLRTPAGDITQPVTCITSSEQYQYEAGDVLLLCVKSQDVQGALEGLDTRLPIVCAQNGVEAERIAAERFPMVYGMMTWLPALHLQPGVVHAYASQPYGIFRLGSYQGGTEAVADRIALHLRDAGFDAQATKDILTWKHTKLLLNLGNAVDAFAEPDPGFGSVVRRAIGEAQACLRITKRGHRAPYEFREEMDAILTPGATIAGEPRSGGSTWQSAARGLPNETEFINGWIVELGDEWGISVPTNRALLRMSLEAQGPRSVPLEQFQRWIREEEFPG